MTLLSTVQRTHTHCGQYTRTRVGSPLSTGAGSHQPAPSGPSWFVQTRSTNVALFNLTFRIYVFYMVFEALVEVWFCHFLTIYTSTLVPSDDTQTRIPP